MSFEKITRLRHALAVLLGTDFAQAHRQLVGRRFEFPLGRCAAAKREDTKFFAHEIQCLPKCTSMRIRTEVAAAVVLFESGEAKTWPFFRKINSDHEETFVVTEGNVVTRSIFFDQFAFEQN